MATTPLTWDDSGKKIYETGVDHGILFPVDPKTGTYGTGVPWNGLVSVTETPSGADANAQYADNIKYINIRAAEDFGGTIEAFTYPPEFAVCDGTVAPVVGVTLGQQSRNAFGLVYRTKVGNDTMGQDYGYKLHLLYGLTASPSERKYETINDSPEAITFSWEVSSTPETVTGFKPTSLITIDSTITTAANMKKIQDILVGASATPRLPKPDEVLTLLGYTAPTQ